jgi:putative transposase
LNIDIARFVFFQNLPCNHFTLGAAHDQSQSRLKRGEAAVWQRRFGEHLIRDEHDFRRHLDHIHYNPVKHGLVKRVRDWAWSSFHRYVRLGEYAGDWGDSAVERKVGAMRCGE